MTKILINIKFLIKAFIRKRKILRSLYNELGFTIWMANWDRASRICNRIDVIKKKKYEEIMEAKFYEI